MISLSIMDRLFFIFLVLISIMQKNENIYEITVSVNYVFFSFVIQPKNKLKWLNMFSKYLSYHFLDVVQFKKYFSVFLFILIYLKFMNYLFNVFLWLHMNNNLWIYFIPEFKGFRSPFWKIHRQDKTIIFFNEYISKQ